MRIETVLLLYNRPVHSERVINSLVDNGVNSVTAYLDQSDREDVNRNHERIAKAVTETNAIDIDLVRRETPYGLARSVRSALDESFANGADAVVVLEDDCVISPGGFRFFEEGLQALRNNRKIRSLCGYTYPGQRFVFDPEADILLLSRFSTWGWATWKDRWEQYEPDLRKLVELAKMINVDIADFSPDIARLCASEKFLSGEVDIWSLNWILLHYLSSTFAAYPKESVIDNIGLDGSGKNCEATTAFSGDVSHRMQRNYNWSRLRYYPENEDIIRDFMAENGNKIYPVP